MSCFVAWMGGKIFSCIMKKVAAIALASGFDFAHATEIGRIEFQPHRGLSIVVRDVYGQSACAVSFEAILGFRVLDELYLMEYWPGCSTKNGWLFLIQQGGWADQERSRSGTCLHGLHPDVKEYLVTGINECVSVFSLEDPAVKSAFDHEQR
ncbi:hypothetical protein [Herbaspirillum huttiense]|uniref:Uncharacterized protein n=1 Tax=Herbaspirillum huttiense subsp. lycopersici TaxID=3074428 RepID=A0ABU2ESL5_9BURK|nr:hypothetical protein [Herbaspirillum huttiense]MDR9850717.1 hypothetical protein [Herbaspirillum huttiense SE1]